MVCTGMVWTLSINASINYRQINTCTVRVCALSLVLVECQSEINSLFLIFFWIFRYFFVLYEKNRTHKTLGKTCKKKVDLRSKQLHNNSLEMGFEPRVQKSIVRRTEERERTAE